MSGSTAVRDYTLLLPPGWARVPLDRKTPARVKALVADRLSAAPPQHREALRTQLTREITQALTTAARHGGLDLLLSLDPVAGQPVPASVLVTHLRVDGSPVESLRRTLASGAPLLDVQELGTVEIAGATAVRRLSTRKERIDPVGELPGGVLHAIQLEFFLPLPGGGGVLLLTFSTPIEQLGPAMVRLFDVMATSLRWIRS